MFLELRVLYIWRAMVAIDVLNIVSDLLSFMIFLL